MIRFRPHLIILVFLLLLAKAPAVSAHRPASTNQDGITELPSISTSYAFYQELETADAVHEFSFQAEAGDFFQAGINIPEIKGLEDYGVVMALLGPGLPGIPARAIPGTAETELLETGIIVPSTKGKDFFEPFTQTNYWGRQTLALNLPETGQYSLVIWNPEGEPGKYVLDTGFEEVFGLTDMFRFPVWWVSVHAYFEHTLHLAVAGLVSLGLVGFAFFMISRIWRRFGRYSGASAAEIVRTQTLTA